MIAHLNDESIDFVVNGADAFVVNRADAPGAAPYQRFMERDPIRQHIVQC